MFVDFCIWVLEVEYPQEVYYLVPPVSVIMTVVNGHLNQEVTVFCPPSAQQECNTRNGW